MKSFLFLICLLFSNLSNAASGGINLPSYGCGAWKCPVILTSMLPPLNNMVGDVILTEDTNTIYVWTGSSWQAVATPGAAIALDGLIGDGTATGPGVAILTLAAVNSNIGSFGSSSAVPSFTVNGKGLITAASSQQLSLTTGVGGILPYANGGTNASTTWTRGSVIFAGSSTLSQDNSKLFWDDTNFYLGIGTSSPAANLNIVMTAIGNIGELINGIASQTADYLDIEDSSSNKVLSFTKFGLLGINKASPAAMIEADSNGTSQVNMILKEIASQTADVLDIENSSNTKLVNVSAAGNVGIATANSVAGSGLNLALPAASAGVTNGMNLSEAAVVFPATTRVMNVNLTSDATAYAASGSLTGIQMLMTNSKPAVSTGSNTGSVIGISTTNIESPALASLTSGNTYTAESIVASSLLASSLTGTTAGQVFNGTGISSVVTNSLTNSASGTNTYTQKAIVGSVASFGASSSAGMLNGTDYGGFFTVAGKTGANYTTTGYAVYASATGDGTNYDFYAASTNPSYFTGPIRVLHVVGNSGSPVITAGAGAGGSPTVFVSGTDLAGIVLVTTGTTPTASAVVATITFSIAYLNNTFIQLSPAGANAALLTGVTAVYPSGATTNFTINSGPTGLTPGTAYIWYYSVAD